MAGVDCINLSSRDGELLFEQTLQPQIFVGDHRNVINQRENGNLCRNKDKYITAGTLSEESPLLELRDENFRKFLAISQVLTFRILVRCISSARPVNLRNEARHREIRVGTGNAILDQQNDPLGNDSQLIVKTHRSVVYDDKEAVHTDVEWLHLYAHRKSVQLLKVSHTIPGYKSDETILVCSVSPGMRREIIRLYNAWLQEFNNIPIRIKELIQDKALVYGYPHGGMQAISFGTYAMYNYTTFSERGVVHKRGMVHSATTCPGSTGAAIVIFKSENGCHKPEVWMHSGQGTLGDKQVNISLVIEYEDTRGPDQEQLTTSLEGRSPLGVRLPFSPIFSSKASRILSFSESFSQDQKKILASMGFFNPGSDIIMCYYCGLQLTKWTNETTVSKLHAHNHQAILHPADCKEGESEIETSRLLQVLNEHEVVTSLQGLQGNVHFFKSAGIDGYKIVNNLVMQRSTDAKIC